MRRAKTTQLTNREIAREARRIFRPLSRSGHHLTLLDGKDALYAVTGKRNLGKKAAVSTTKPFLDAFLKKGWISPVSATAWALNESGAAWLRRAQADDSPFATQHRLESTRRFKAANGSFEQLRVNDGEDPLGWLRARKGRGGKPLLNAAQMEAGLRLRHDFTLGHFTPRLTASWEHTGQGRKGRRNRAGAGVELSDSTLAARQRFRKSLNAVGPELSGVLVDICCFLKGLEEAEKANGWPQRSGKLVLQMALTALARHYGLISDQAAPRRHALVHWGTADYRPEIDGFQDSSALRASS
jgi:hypothetical protein